MYKEILGILTACVLFTGNLFSQISDTAFWLNDTFPKNEIAVNTTPGVPFLFGSTPMQPRFGIRYSHIQKGGNAIRFGLNIQLDNRGIKFSDEFNDYYGNNYVLVSQTDTTQLRRYSYTNIYPRYFVSGGLEIHLGDEKIFAFFGADLTLGTCRHEKMDKDYFFIKDTVYGGGLFELEPINKGGFIAFHSKVNYLVTGITPFYGFKYFFAEKVGLSIQMGANLLFYYGTQIENDYLNGTSNERTVSFVDFELPGIVNDLSIIFRF